MFLINRNYRPRQERPAAGEQTSVPAGDRWRSGRRGSCSNDETMLGGRPQRATRLSGPESYHPPSQQVMMTRITAPCSSIETYCMYITTTVYYLSRCWRLTSWIDVLFCFCVYTCTYTFISPVLEMRSLIYWCVCGREQLFSNIMLSTLQWLCVVFPALSAIVQTKLADISCRVWLRECVPSYIYNRLFSFDFTIAVN